MLRVLCVSFCMSFFAVFFTFPVKAQTTASDVFIGFVIEQLGPSAQVEDMMGPDWFHQIVLLNSSWNVTDAQHFLSVLKESDVESQHILNILQATSYLKALRLGKLHFEFTEAEGISSAEDVFLDFITDHLESIGQIEEFEQIMGFDWIDQISLLRDLWSDEDAQHFLDILTGSDVSSEHILKMLQAISYLKALRQSHLHFEFQVQSEVINEHPPQSPSVVDIPEQLRVSEFAFLNIATGDETPGHPILIEFINASREHLGINFDEIIGQSWDQAQWEERLTRWMNKGGWTQWDARKFVLFLVGRIGLKGTLKRVKENASYMSFITYLDFREKVLFYDDFLGKDVVDELLNKSIGGFRKKNSISELRAIISFIHKYIEGEEELKEFVKKQIINIAKATHNHLVGVEAFLLEYGFNEVEIKTLLQKSFVGFVYAKPESLRAVAEFLINGRIKTKGQWQTVFDWEGANFTQSEVKELMQMSFQGFARAKPENLRAVAEFLINGRIKIKGEWQVAFNWEGANFTKSEVKELMQMSFQGFALAKPESLHVVAAFLINEYDFITADVKTLIQGSFQGVAHAKPESLHAVAEFLINGRIKIKGEWQVVFDWKRENFTKSEVKELMQKSFTSFASAKPESLHAVAEFLINGKIKIKGEWQVAFNWEGANFTQEEVKILMQEKFNGFARAKPESLRAVAEFLINEYDFTKKEVKNLMKKSFDGFARAKPESLRAVAEFLINGKIKINGQWQVVFDWKGENFTKSEVKELMEKSFQGFAHAKPESLHAVAEFLINGKVKINGEWKVIFNWESANFQKAEVKTLMQESFDGFVPAKPESLHAVAEFLINGKIKINGQWQVVFDWKGENFTKSEVKELMQKSLQGFASAKAERLRAVAEFLINEYNFTEADIKILMQKNFFGFTLAEVKVLKGIAESGIDTYMEKSEIKSKIQYNIQSFLNINFRKLTPLIRNLQHTINSLLTDQKELWEGRLKQTLLDHLLQEDLIEQLQRLQNTIQASSGPDQCQSSLRH